MTVRTKEHLTIQLTVILFSKTTHYKNLYKSEICRLLGVVNRSVDNTASILITVKGESSFSPEKLKSCTQILWLSYVHSGNWLV